MDVNPTANDGTIHTLDSLMAEVEHSNDDQKDLLLEHLNAAKMYLIGSMPTEYQYSLHSAKEVADELADSALQKRVKEQIDGLDPHA